MEHRSEQSVRSEKRFLMNKPRTVFGVLSPSTGRRGGFASRLLIVAGLILMLTLTSLLPATPPALAQAPQGNSAQAGPNAVESGGPYVFALPAKDSKLFYRYDISANAWAKMADIPAKVNGAAR